MPHDGPLPQYSHRRKPLHMLGRNPSTWIIPSTTYSMLILGLTVPNRLQALLRQPWVWKMTRLE